jgi:lysophospholipase L1-like esterase
MHKHRLVLLVAAACVALVAAALPGVASAKSKSKPAPHYYVALGDSLSRGMQPNVFGETLNTNQGYANDLLPIERHHVHNLQLVQLGCGGETSGSMLTGKGNVAIANDCKPAGGSQEAAAIRFLKRHHKKGEVPLITVDIGANDVQECAKAPPSQIASCVATGLSTIGENLPKILARLRQAAPKGTTFAAMTLYDPILGSWFAPGHGLAAASVALTQAVNGKLSAIDASGGFLTADVAGAFNTYDMADTVTWENQQIPVDVANVCSWTWACQTPPSGPNIHANKNGYQVIASAFASVIGKRVH